MAALGNALARDDMRRYVIPGGLKAKVKPLMAQEVFSAAPRALSTTPSRHDPPTDEKENRDHRRTHRLGEPDRHQERQCDRLRGHRAGAGPADRPDRRGRSRPGDAHAGTRCRAPSATRCRSPTAPTGRGPHSTTPVATCTSVPHPPYVDTTGTPGQRAVVRRVVAVRRARRGPALRRGLGHPVDRGRRRGDGQRRRRLGHGDAAAALAADDRQRAPLPRAVDRRDRRPGGRRGAVRRAVGGPHRARREPRPGPRDPLRRPRGLSRGGRRPGPRLLGGGPGLRPRPVAGPVPGRGALVHASRPRERPVEDRVRLRRDRLAAP